VHVCSFACVCLCVYVRVCDFVGAFVSVCVCMCAYVCGCAGERERVHAHVCMEVRVCINICKSDPLFFGRIVSDTSEKSSEYDADTHVPTYS